MTSRIGRWLAVIVVVLLLVVIGAGVYARDAWQQWMANQSIQKFDWQGIHLSLGGIRADSFSLVSSDPARRFTVRGSDFLLGWNWQSLSLASVRVEQLAVEIPAWPEPAPDGSGTSQPRLPEQFPVWLPESISVGNLQIDLPEGTGIRGNLYVELAPDPNQWRIKTTELWVSGLFPEFESGGWRFSSIGGRIGLAGTAGVESARLDVLDGSRVQVDGVISPEGGGVLALEQVEARPGGSTLDVGYNLNGLNLEKLRLAGPLVVDVGTLKQPNLKPQFWSLEGQLDANLNRLDVRGLAEGAAGLVLDIDARWPFQGTAQVAASTVLEGSDASRTLAATLEPWPAGIEISDGRLSAQADVRLPGTGPALEGKIIASGMSGIAGRIAWTDLNGILELSVGDTLVARTSELQLAQINPGVPLGPVSITGSYRASLQALTEGTVSLIRGHAGFLGGELRARPGDWNLANLPVTVPVWLNDIQVERLMTVYPAEGLAGSGTLEGEVPLLIGRDGVQVADGHIRAVAPGGTLRLPADRLQALARNNETMDLVVRALQNFNYSVLNSTIDYDQEGTLNLGLRLEGSNPQVRDGHPIVVNINLQEDIPALLTSLQLSGRVNEAVTEKVRKLMEQREAGNGEN
ncbi:YdbH domain-containing protein [Marinobacter pelagius]|uniref:intermembrane phospholipid transport protein YdbH family protein n=1 Tax=Marinobacter sp. C7 TaxID=2951363 RepID=UPI001EF0D7B6|nr:YdbH domain-containing protein [Marinobacter sp. C7]MCG7201240.1 YdbH domain-containing protein [Marinobacter sp. C7]